MAVRDDSPMAESNSAEDVFSGLTPSTFDVESASPVPIASNSQLVSAEEQTQRILAERLGLPFIKLSEYHVDDEVLNIVPADFARTHNIIPISVNHSHIQVAMAFPMRQELYQSLSFITGLTVDASVTTLKDVQWAINHYYGIQSDDFDSATIETTESLIDEMHELERLGSERPIVRLVSTVIRDAIERNASDIHVRPGADNVELVYRVDGSLISVREFSKSLLPAVVSRIKIIGGMNIAERRVPQDGRCCVRTNGFVVDLRISIMPTVEGESVVIRILNSQVGLRPISELGFSPHDEDVLRDILHKNHGVFLVTGPTGSGKSTTLYAALAEVQKQNVNILTVEDPVEYHMDGIQQIQINHAIGYTFARALRNILRHDPDVILVGEIRDNETCKIAVESALTGHLVLSTLHTNDAPGAVTRLLEMGIEPYLLTGSLLGVLAQRLVKKNCPHCLAVEPVDIQARQSLAIDADEEFYHSIGCEHCHQTGIDGRVTVYELMCMTEAIKKIVTPDVDTAKIYKQAIKQGMVTLTDNALQRARAKEISLAEVYRVRLD
ncbi:MAG: type II/IV secretion system protein [Proteobacteria bacterium]|nr:type II/IV secretion system protein [Pseudomonadota bacterium]